MLSNCKIRGNPEKSMKASKTRHLNHINHVRHAVDVMQVRNARHEDTQYTLRYKSSQDMVRAVYLSNSIHTISLKNICP